MDLLYLFVPFLIAFSLLFSFPSRLPFLPTLFHGMHFFFFFKKYNPMISCFVDFLCMVTLGIFLSDSDPSTLCYQHVSKADLYHKLWSQNFQTRSITTSTPSTRTGSFNQKAHDHNTTFLKRIHIWYIF